MRKNRLSGVLVASAALALMGGVSTGCAEAQAQVKCAGINSCGGKGECAAADGSHDCGGKNSCKGKGWQYSDSAADCTSAGGTVL